MSRVTISMGRKFISPKDVAERGDGARFTPHEVSVSVEATLDPTDHDQKTMELLRSIVKQELEQSMKKEIE